jgi:hypothetical protein
MSDLQGNDLSAGGLGTTTGWVGTVLGTPDPPGLARFYAGLLGGEPDLADPSFATLALAGSTHYLAFQLEPDHQPPEWPQTPGGQQMQLHLDVGVTDVATAVAEVVALGATEADFQPQEDVRVMLDPAGHPFCLYLDRD